jgi:hypothetical protein
VLGSPHERSQTEDIELAAEDGDEDLMVHLHRLAGGRDGCLDELCEVNVVLWGCGSSMTLYSYVVE